MFLNGRLLRLFYFLTETFFFFFLRNEVEFDFLRGLSYSEGFFFPLVF